MNPSIHPSALISASAELGADVTIGPFSIVHGDVTIAAGAQIGAHCELGGGGGRVLVGAAAKLRKGCRVEGEVEIGEGASIGENAVVEGTVALGRGASIAAQATVAGQIRLGDAVKIGASTALVGQVSIGEGTEVFNGCSIGAQAQHPAFSTPLGAIEIGRRCVLREFTTVHLPTTDGFTRIGDDCYIMAGCHINHDSRIGDDVKMANAATMGGYVHVGDHAYLGMHCVIHQRMRIGEYAMIGMNAVVVRHVPPYATVVGSRFTKINRMGLSIRNVDEAEIDVIEAYYRNGVGMSATSSSWTARIDAFEAECDGVNVMRPRFTER